MKKEKNLLDTPIRRGYPAPMKLSPVTLDTMKKLRVGVSVMIAPLDTQAAYRAARKLGYKITIRQLPQGVHLWRVA